MKNLAGMLKQASQMQEKMAELQAKLAATEVEGAAGAGMVRITLNGKSEMRAIAIDPKLFAAGDADMLQDLILAAHADAKRRAEAASSEEMQKLTAGLPLPPGFKLPF